MEWWDLSDDEVEGGALEFDDSRLELHVYQRRDGAPPVAAWLNDDASYFCRVEMAEA